MASIIRLLAMEAGSQAPATTAAAAHRRRGSTARIKPQLTSSKRRRRTASSVGLDWVQGSVTRRAVLNPAANDAGLEKAPVVHEDCY